MQLTLRKFMGIAAGAALMPHLALAMVAGYCAFKYHGTRQRALGAADAAAAPPRGGHGFCLACNGSGMSRTGRANGCRVCHGSGLVEPHEIR